MEGDRERLHDKRTFGVAAKEYAQNEISMQAALPYVAQQQPAAQAAAGNYAENVERASANKLTSRENNMARLLLGPLNATTNCPLCFASIRTTIKYTTTNRTHTTAALCSMCFCLCCCFLPYFLSSTRNVDHYCPNCDGYLGTYEK